MGVFKGIDENIVIKCFDASLNVIGYVDEFRSFTWGYSWSGIGNWTLIADIQMKHTVSTLQAATYICVQNIPSMTYLTDANGPQAVWGIVEAYKTQNKQSGDTITITGTELKSLAHRRIILHKNTYSKVARECMGQLLSAELVNPTEANRQIKGGIDNSTYCKSTGTTEQIPEQYTNLADNLINLAEEHELGWAARLNLQTKGIEWYIADGNDRTFGQTKLNPMLLDFTHETIDEATYDVTVDSQNYAYIGGQGKEDKRKIEHTYITGTDFKGIHRYEIFVNAPNEADADLVGKGQEALNEYSGKTTVKLTPSFTFLQKFGETYQLGDVGTFFMPNGGKLNMRLTSAELNFENNSVGASFTFGYDKKTIKTAMNILLRSYRNMLNA